MIPLVWITTIAALLAQYLIMRQVAAETLAHAKGLSDLSRHQADWWRFAAIVVPWCGIATALFLQWRWFSGWMRALSAVGLILMLPATIFLLIAFGASGPVAMDHIRLATGERFVLAAEPSPTDAYTLYRASGPFGAWWHPLTYLDYPEDRRFEGESRLIASSSGNWLLVARAGVWTDCFRIVRSQPIACKLATTPYWTKENYAEDMLARSTEIRALTGMTPPS